MRNLVEYPITYDEAISALQTTQREYYKNRGEEGIGSTRGVSLLLVEQFILSRKKEFNDFSKKSLTVVDMNDQ